jgi:hypothetical protein
MTENILISTNGSRKINEPLRGDFTAHFLLAGLPILLARANTLGQPRLLP